MPSYKSSFKSPLTVSLRRPSREVRVGDVLIGGTQPIRIQSMVIAHTIDTKSVVSEAIELYEAGAEIVRITVPVPRDAEYLALMQKELKKNDYNIPIVADIHFSPKTALIAAQYADKVRINPGNYSDSKHFKKKEYSQKEYDLEIERAYEQFRPLLRRCNELDKSIRIGVNHGSLSDRIMNKYGDNPIGMVESALEFVRMAQQESFHNIILSMKSSNPIVMLEAYRLLVSQMDKEKMNYPLHLGVTEAGDGLSARMKSALGIGTLLEEGIGDTIRVSLTENSIHEIAAARNIICSLKQSQMNSTVLNKQQKIHVTPSIVPQRHALEMHVPQMDALKIQTNHKARIFLKLDLSSFPKNTTNESVERLQNFQNFNKEEDLLYLSMKDLSSFCIPDSPFYKEQLSQIFNVLIEGISSSYKYALELPALNNTDEFLAINQTHHKQLSTFLGSVDLFAFSISISIEEHELSQILAKKMQDDSLPKECQKECISIIEKNILSQYEKIKEMYAHIQPYHKKSTQFLFQLDFSHELIAILDLHSIKKIVSSIFHLNEQIKYSFFDSSTSNTNFYSFAIVNSNNTQVYATPFASYLYYIFVHAILKQGSSLVLRAHYSNLYEGIYRSSIELSPFLLKKLANQIFITIDQEMIHETSLFETEAVLKSYFQNQSHKKCNEEYCLEISQELLQTTRIRMSKPDYISCPSCGRTLFDLQETTKRIKDKTKHLKGVKIGIMGCVVNGPGEMADADFGYVGAAPGKIHLYKGQKKIKSNVSEEHADEELIQLMKSYNMWQD